MRSAELDSASLLRMFHGARFHIMHDLAILTDIDYSLAEHHFFFVLASRICPAPSIHGSGQCSVVLGIDAFRP